MSIDINTILLYGSGIIILYILARSLSKPMNFVLKIIINTILGAVGLLIVNYIGGLFGFHIAFNIITALVTGFLGIPGIVLLILLKSIFGI